MKQTQTTLAAALAVIGKDGQELESKATTVLRIVRAEKITDGKAFNAAVRKAYVANGWKGGPGKPKAGSEKLATVPATVKQYVSAIRAAFRLKLPVASYTSMTALRAELKEKRAKAAKRNAKVEAASTPKELIGIRLREPEHFNGGPFHDLAVLYNALDRSRRPKMLSALDRVKREFAMAAPQLVLPHAMPELRKAA